MGGGCSVTGRPRTCSERTCHDAEEEDDDDDYKEEEEEEREGVWFFFLAKKKAYRDTTQIILIIDSYEKQSSPEVRFFGELPRNDPVMVRSLLLLSSRDLETGRWENDAAFLVPLLLLFV